MITDLVFADESKNGFDLIRVAGDITGDYKFHCVCSTIADAPEILQAASKLGVQIFPKTQLMDLMVEVTHPAARR